jgi:plasmid replication initiation protein
MKQVKAVDKPLDGTEMITKHNVFVRASYRLTVQEVRLILMIIGQMKNSKVKSNDTLFTLRAEDYSRIYNVALSHSYVDIEEAAKELYNRTLSLDEYTDTRWIQTRFNYIKGSGYIQLRLADIVLPYIQELESHFTAYYLNEVRNLRTIYSVRLFELCKSYLSMGEWIVDLEQFKSILGLDEDYRIDHVSNRVIIPAIEAINEHTSLVIGYSKIKRGRVITGFSFTIDEKVHTPLKAKEVQDDRTRALELLNNDSWVSEHALIGESWTAARARLKQELDSGKFSLAPTN